MSTEPGTVSPAIGLTGGVASGKSTVAGMFADLGITIVDTDLIARSVVEPGKPALEEIRASFGNDMIASDGTLDRQAMRRRIFGNDALRLQLNAILHPRIRAEAARLSRAAPGPYHVVVVPLLAESPMKSDMQRIVVVDCDETTQLQRLLERDADSPEQARRIIAAQASRAERLAIADDVIDNGGEVDDTRRQVEALHRHYLSLFGDA